MHQTQHMSDKSNIEEGSVTWKSPSNIALVKYWGKHGVQLPSNPSISFTLSESYTQSTLEYTRKEEKGFDIQVLLDGEKKRKKVYLF